MNGGAGESPGISLIVTLVVFSLYPDWHVFKKALLFWLLGGPIIASVAFLLGGGRKTFSRGDASRDIGGPLGWFHQGGSQSAVFSWNGALCCWGRYIFIGISWRPVCINERNPNERYRYRHEKITCFGQEWLNRMNFIMRWRARGLMNWKTGYIIPIKR